MDYDDAYSNMIHIPGGAGYPDRWAERAAAFRAASPRAELGLAHGPGPRERFDLFHPEGAARGLVVFVHGGYWLQFDRAWFSHLAGGALRRGWAVAMPSYDLCPDIRIAGITRQIRQAIAAAAGRVAGPLRLAGHSAGGHLVARMACADMAPDWQGRLERVVPISPVSDLEPLTHTAMNADLRIDAAEVAAESPARLAPCGADVRVWVGGDERPVFLDQARWLAERWQAPLLIEPGRHHFDVIEGLEHPDSALTEALLGR